MEKETVRMGVDGTGSWLLSLAGFGTDDRQPSIYITRELVYFIGTAFY
jgi:hypothetical protein